MKELITYPLNDVDYSAEDAGLFHCTRTSGVWQKDSFPITVSGSDNTVTIGKGLAWFSNDEFWGKVAAQKTVVELDLEYTDPAYDRIDVIALQFDANKNATNLIVKKGEAKANPTIPAISRTEALYELYLYAITRPAASLTVTSENVIDLRLDDAYCGLMADSVTSLDFPVIPIEKGGTGATVRNKAIANLIELPINTEPSEDTPSAWNSIGTCKIFFNTSSKVLNKPTVYGTLLNFSNATVGVVQIWFKHGYGDMYIRAGNADGWNNRESVFGGDAWTRVYTTNDVVPIEGGGTGQTVDCVSETFSSGDGEAKAFDLTGISNYTIEYFPYLRKVYIQGSFESPWEVASAGAYSTVATLKGAFAKYKPKYYTELTVYPAAFGSVGKYRMYINTGGQLRIQALEDINQSGTDSVQLSGWWSV